MQKDSTPKLNSQAIYINGKDRTEEMESYSFEGDKCVVVYKNNGKSYSYHQSKIEIIQSALQTQKSADIFSYLKAVAETTGLKSEDGRNSLADSYERISFIPETSIVSNYLSQKLPEKNVNSSPVEIFPFGFNLSQKKGVDEAFANPLSVIEGPPGTGKTQTILNIIANAVMNNQSVAVVSNNNSATQNVFEKLEACGLSFLAAQLGSLQNKKAFIENQAELPDLSEYHLTDEKRLILTESNSLLFAELSEKLEQKNELAHLRLEIDALKTEYEHFTNSTATIFEARFRKNTNSHQLLSLWIKLEDYENANKKLKWWHQLIFPLKYGIKDKYFYELTYHEMIQIVQEKYYQVKITELELRKSSIEKALHDFSFNDKMKEYTRVSMLLFKNFLYKKYQGIQRPVYSESDFRLKSQEFINDYPIILSTTYSLTRSLSKEIMYDFVIVDESSQVNLASGVLSLSCAKRAVVVGDLKQLPNVVEKEMVVKTDQLFDEYQIPEPYRYSTQSLLSSLSELFLEIPKTLLREHYRCHPRIIDFCNKKFYNDQLIILSENKKEREPLLVYRTVVGNHAREQENQRQIDVITQEIIPQQMLENANLGIVTPYRNQTTALQSVFVNTDIKADTVDKFQGRENDVIILSTVDNEISDFTDNANRLNVAISRAKDQLIVLVNGNETQKDNNISDLIRYIEYNNFTVVHSEIYSVFDYLYQGYEEQRRKLLSKQKNTSVFDSENLMHVLIKEVLSEQEFSKYDVMIHFPLRSLFIDYDKLSEKEKRYAQHHATHLDFLIYNKLGKNPVLAIEVDGYEYHKTESRQGERDAMKNQILEKYKLPLLRFSTTGSGKREKLIKALRNVHN